ncbi:FAD-dependent oxidoreductase, partial [Paracoccaceae bacterium]|nr:FAD-dependent oxidoreductase [Paracoccaceae bacterium]
MNFDYDLFVIGGGSGGVRAARVTAALDNKRVALAEMDRYGGTCVIRGCVPKKLMVFASEFSSIFTESRSYGWDLQKDNGLNWNYFSGKLSAEVLRLENIYRNLLKNSGVKTFDQHAKVIDEHTVELANGEQFTSEYILLATGGKPDLPNIPGIDHVLTSDQIFSLSALPQKLLIVGGGYIACEFASIFTGLGSKVTQFCRGETILRGFDNEATSLVADQMKSNGVDLQYGINVVKISKLENSFRITDNYGRVQDFDQILFATGRVPNSCGLQNSSAGLSVGDNGEIIVNKYSQSSIESIYAIGDLTDRKQLTPIAIKEAMAFVQT